MSGGRSQPAMAVGCQDGAPGLPVPCGGKRLLTVGLMALTESWGLQEPRPHCRVVPCYSGCRGHCHGVTTIVSPSPARGASWCRGKRLFPARNSPGTASPRRSGLLAPLPTLSLQHRWIQPPRVLFGEKTPRDGTWRWRRRLARRSGTPVGRSQRRCPPARACGGSGVGTGRAARAQKHEKAEEFPPPCSANREGRGEGGERRRRERAAEPGPARALSHPVPAVGTVGGTGPPGRLPTPLQGDMGLGRLQGQAQPVGTVGDTRVRAHPPASPSPRGQRPWDSRGAQGTFPSPARRRPLLKQGSRCPWGAAGAGRCPGVTRRAQRAGDPSAPCPQRHQGLRSPQGCN